jgi:hypothetical protein
LHRDQAAALFGRRAALDKLGERLLDANRTIGQPNKISYGARGVEGTESLQTHRWRGLDSNLQFRAR